MPQHVRFIARYGNGTLALLLAVIALFGGNLIIALACIPIIALVVYDIYVIEKAARLMDEEPWLESEIHKIELRRKLASMQAEEAAADPGPGYPTGT